MLAHDKEDARLTHPPSGVIKGGNQCFAPSSLLSCAILRISISEQQLPLRLKSALTKKKMSASEGCKVVSKSGSPGFVSTLAGGGTSDVVPQGFLSSKLPVNGALAFSPDGARLYFATMHSTGTIHYLDFETRTVQKLLTGLGSIRGMCCDPPGTLYYSSVNKLFKLDVNTNEVHGVAGGGPNGNDATGESAGFVDLCAMAVDGNGDLLVIDNNRIRKVSLLPRGAEVSTVCGGLQPGHVDGFGGVARFNKPRGICWSNDGNIFVADANNHRIRKVRPETWEVTTVAGDGQPRIVDGQGTAASFKYPCGITTVEGWVYALGKHAVRCVSPMGHVTTIAGSEIAGYEDSVGAQAKFQTGSMPSSQSPSHCTQIATDGKGTLVVTDIDNARLRSLRVERMANIDIPPPELLADLEALLDDEDGSDLTLTVQGKPLHTLRGLLSKRCSYFRTMLASGFKESNERKINIEEGSYDAVRAVLTYLHTDSLRVQDEHAMEVAQLADAWDLPRLQSMAQDAITRSVDAKNVCSFLIGAGKYRATELKTFCIRFIIYNFAQVQASGSFPLLDKELLCEVIQQLRM